MTSAPARALPHSAAVTALEQQIGLLFATARTLMRNRAAAIHPDLSPGAYHVLAMLTRCGPRHAGSLASELGIDKSAMSRLVRQLSDLGLVERQPDPDDGRAFFVAATAGATRRIGDLRDEHRAALRQFLDGWEDGDIAQLTALLARLNEARSQLDL